MTPLSRRKVLRMTGGAVGALALPAGCGRPRPDYPDLPPKGHVIDAHCHLFNGTDLPITTFLTRLALRSYDEARCDLRAPPARAKSLRGRTIEDPSAIETLVNLAISWLLEATPTAKEELDLLTRDHTTPADSDRARVRRLTERNLAAFLDETPPGAATARATGEDRLRALLQQEAAAADQAARATSPRTLSSRDAAANLLRSDGTFAALIRWVEHFFRSRQSLAQELVTASTRWGRPPLMLVPMLVDYTHWLGETPSPHSSFFDQIAVYGALCKRSPVPIHGMVPFDPLRDVFWRMGRHNRFPDTSEFDPLDLAEQALTDHGFLGLKVYPPMGFRATANLTDDAAYPVKAVKALQLPPDTLGVELDRSMLRAMDFCLRHDAPMLAHANNSVAAGQGYGRRAEPRFWIDAFTDRPNLRLALAHGGGFCWRQSTLAPDKADETASWEWAIGSYVRAHPTSHLYMDISYFSEIFSEGTDLDYIARSLSRWIKDFDPDARHLLYGTDWIMLEREPQFYRYGVAVEAFLKDRCHLTDTQLERVMWQNALRFHGLDSGKTRDRILEFYGSRRPDWTRLALT